MTIHKSCPCHPANYKAGRAGSIKYLVIHYVGALGGAEANARYYGTTPGIGASAHYFVDHRPRAEVWASVAEGDTAWHCGAKTYKHPECRNANSIGIEMCCHRRADGTWYFDPETIDRTVELARDIMARYGIDVDHVVRHYDVTGKRCPAPYVNEPAAWAAFKDRLTAQEGDTDMTREEIQGMVDEAVVEALRAREAAVSVQPVSLWASEAWQKATSKSIFDGTDPQGALTREQAAVVLDRLKLI